jgi:RNase P subunit RPR2
MAEINGTPNVPALPEARRFVCGKCNINYPMGKETTLYVYRKQAWFNHLVTNCVKCHRDYTIWYIPVAECGYMMANNTRTKGDVLVIKMEDYCDDIKIIREFCLDNNKPMPEDRWLSPRELKRIDTRVAWWAYLLDHGEAP